MGKQRQQLSDQIRQAIKDAPMSRYAICKAIGFNQATMSRFMSGEAGLSMQVLDRLANLLDLNISVGRSKTERSPPRKKAKREVRARKKQLKKGKKNHGNRF